MSLKIKDNRPKNWFLKLHKAAFEIFTFFFSFSALASGGRNVMGKKKKTNWTTKSIMQMTVTEQNVSFFPQLVYLKLRFDTTVRSFQLQQQNCWPSLVHKGSGNKKTPRNVNNLILIWCVTLKTLELWELSGAFLFFCCCHRFRRSGCINEQKSAAGLNKTIALFSERDSERRSR